MPDTPDNTKPDDQALHHERMAAVMQLPEQMMAYVMACRERSIDPRTALAYMCTMVYHTLHHGAEYMESQIRLAKVLMDQAERAEKAGATAKLTVHHFRNEDHTINAMVIADHMATPESLTTLIRTSEAHHLLSTGAKS